MAASRANGQPAGRVEFFLNADSVGVASGAATGFDLPALEPGTYTLTAVATDTNNRASKQSAPVILTVTAPAAGGPAFFNGAADVGGGFSYLPGFGYFKLLPDNPGYVYHNDLGFLFYIDANDGKGGIYFYDFATTPGARSLGFFYTAPGFPFPYLYSFDLRAFLYYFPDNQRGTGFFTTSPRIFTRLDTGEFLFQELAIRGGAEARSRGNSHAAPEGRPPE